MYPLKKLWNVQGVKKNHNDVFSAAKSIHGLIMNERPNTYAFLATKKIVAGFLLVIKIILPSFKKKKKIEY